MSKLVIVESPTKAKTIEKYLGSDFKVIASVGHIRDLPKSKLGVDTENGFIPLYENMKDKDKVIKELVSKAKKSEAVFLATDPDREGEAISWHLATILGIDAAAPIRVTFSEITKNGVTTGMANPRGVDMDLVNAQQARRVLDRILGYKLSPFLWKKVRKGLSAGRVQSVTVRIIVEREREIEAFKPQEYWSVSAKLKKLCDNPNNPNNSETLIEAKLYEVKGKKIVNKGEKGEKADKSDKAITIENEVQAREILSLIQGGEFIVKNVKKSKRKKQPAPPFTTSTLQQEASGKLSFGSIKTMKIAQELYEGVNVPGYGVTGLITYMRTDSLRISDDAKAAAKTLISSLFGEDYLPEVPRVYKSKNNSQDAHEAIRPAIIEITPKTVKGSLTADQYKLYKLIWDRFMASQMANAILDMVSVDIGVNECVFRASGHTVNFDGFTRVYENQERSGDNAIALPVLEKGEGLIPLEITPSQHFTQPPPRYTEASLIKTLEENGIGRPSTYAPTISTIVKRQYVEKAQKQLKPTSLAFVTTELFELHFSNIIDSRFTAQMEENLDKIEVGAKEWVSVLSDFYGDFEQTLSKAESEMEGKRMKIPDEPTDIVCDECGKNMVIKLGRFGRFLGCSGFPECTNTKKIVIETKGFCPKCGKKMLSRKSKKGRTFFACEDFTDCKFMTWDNPIGDKCPKCKSTLFEKTGKSKGEKGTHCLKEGCDYTSDKGDKGHTEK